MNYVLLFSEKSLISSLTKLQYLSIFICLFANVISLIRGFFECGFKRSIKNKYFADTIPLYNWFNDKMDLEMLHEEGIAIFIKLKMIFGK